VSATKTELSDPPSSGLESDALPSVEKEGRGAGRDETSERLLVSGAGAAGLVITAICFYRAAFAVHVVRPRAIRE
jgi:hypothetical protein